MAISKFLCIEDKAMIFHLEINDHNIDIANKKISPYNYCTEFRINLFLLVKLEILDATWADVIQKDANLRPSSPIGEQLLQHRYARC
jgi:hypothetical protein